MMVLTAGLPAQAQQAGPDPALPPVVVHPGQPSARPPGAAQQARSRNAAHRASRTSRSNANPAPVSPASDTSSTNQGRDGVDGYVARTTEAGAKVGTPILQWPRSVSTVTRQEMTDRDVQSVRDALQYTAGVSTYFREGQFTRDYVSIRGFQGLQFLDGLRLNVNNYGLEPYGLERIDVLKGPAATLYGQGSPGGLWDLVSKRPTDQAFGEVLLRMGIRNSLEGAFDVGGPVTSDHSLLYRVVGLGRIGDGQIDFTKDERAFIAPSFTWRIDEDTSLTILAAYQNDPKLTVLQPLPYAGTIVPGPTGQFISRNLFLGEPSYHNTSVQQARIGYEFKHQFNDVFSFQQNFYYQNIDINLNEVQSSATPNTTTTNRIAANQTFQIDMYQIDNRLKADFDMGPLRHHVLFGADYSAVPNFQGTGTGAASPLNLYNPIYGQPFASPIPITTFRYQDQRQAGAYVQDRTEIGRLSVLLGARYDQLQQDQKTRSLNLATGVLSNPPWTRQPDHALTYNAGLIYAFDNGVAPYASYSQTFTPTAGTDFFGRAFIPVTGDQKEVGIKYMPPGYDILATAAVFDITQYNVLTADLAHRGFAVQTSSVQSQGGEIELKTTRLYGFNISAAYTYLDTKVIATNTAGGLGKHPVGIPMNQASLWTTYRFAGGDLAGVTLGGGVRFVGDQAVDALNTLAVLSFTLYDFTARYELGELSPRFKKWDIALNVKNLLDERYIGSCDDALNCYYGPGRNITGTLRARW
ncbi:TonB-dependent siderophore receptor [Bradyrhizobium sp. USDA 10063]